MPQTAVTPVCRAIKIGRRQYIRWTRSLGVARVTLFMEPEIGLPLASRAVCPCQNAMSPCYFAYRSTFCMYVFLILYKVQSDPFCYVYAVLLCPVSIKRRGVMI